MSLRLPEVRQGLLSDVATLATAAAGGDDVAVGEAVEEVWHLLDPSHGHEPGDVLEDADEVALGTALWRTLERVEWPLDAKERAASSTWAEVVRAADAFLVRAIGPRGG